MTFPVENTCLKFIWIVLKSNDAQKNQNFIIDSVIELNPFYFDSQITLKNRDFEFFTDYLLNYLSDFYYWQEFF